MWKYGCTRGVQGTPTFFANGFEIEAFSWTGEDWTDFVKAYGGRKTYEDIVIERN